MSTTQSPRQPADIIKAILANLEQEMLFMRGPEGSTPHPIDAGAAMAYKQCITLIRTEAASLLTVTP